MQHSGARVNVANWSFYLFLAQVSVPYWKETHLLAFMSFSPCLSASWNVDASTSLSASNAFWPCRAGLLGCLSVGDDKCRCFFWPWKLVGDEVQDPALVLDLLCPCTRFGWVSRSEGLCRIISLCVLCMYLCLSGCTHGLVAWVSFSTLCRSGMSGIFKVWGHEKANPANQTGSSVAATSNSPHNTSNTAHLPSCFLV